MNFSGSGKFFNGFPLFEGRIELDQWLRPKLLVLDLPVDKLPDNRILDVDKTPNILLIVFNQMLVEVEDVHNIEISINILLISKICKQKESCSIRQSPNFTPLKINDGHDIKDKNKYFASFKNNMEP